MKTRRIFPPLVVLILAALVVTSATSASIEPERASASGFGEFRWFHPQRLRTELWSFSFEANANKNGQARGRAQFDNLATQTQVVVRINCLSAVFGSAVMSGRVLHSDDPDLPKHANVVFAATDAQTLPFIDTITPLFPFGDLTCHDTQPLTILPVENGDIQIDP